MTIRPMRTARIWLLGLLVAVVAGVLVDPSPAAAAGAPPVVWENRGQSSAPDANGLDVDGDGRVLVVSGGDGDSRDGRVRWYVRGIDRKTGATLWEDSYGPMRFGLAKDVEVEGGRAYVAGWILSDTVGFVWVVRAYELRTGALVWSREVSVGPDCVAEFQGFGRCVAKALSVHGGRVFVVGHLSRGATRSDFTVIAYDTDTGETVWQSVVDPHDAKALDYGWAVSAAGNTVTVIGEVLNYAALLIRSYDAETGALRWERFVPGVRNFTGKDTLVADTNHIVIAGTDEHDDGFVQGRDARTGDVLWTDTFGDGDKVGSVWSLALADGRVYANGVGDCDPETFVDCTLEVRAYDTADGLEWRHPVAPPTNGDWTAEAIVAGGGAVYFTGLVAGEDGRYEPMVGALDADDGGARWLVPFATDDVAVGSATGFASGLALLDGQRLIVSGTLARADSGEDFVTRQYGV